MPETLPDIVISYLKSLQERGIEQVPIDEEARLVLRNWMLASRRGKSTTKSQPTAPAPDAPSAAPVGTADINMPQPAERMFRMEEEATSPQAPAAEEDPLEIHLQGKTLEEQLFALRSLAEHWDPARSLGTLRDTMVFAVGDPHSKLMLIGEAPGYHEELEREPFVGRAGEKLNGILKAMGIKRESIYISNIVKFRPSMPRQTTNNRAPSEKEIAVSMPIISKEIELIRPQAIIALGATAARGLLGTGQAPLSSLRGRFHQFMDIPVRVTYHPSYLLRTEELSERRKVWEDMLAVMELLSMPISDKQRSYFLPKH